MNGKIIELIRKKINLKSNHWIHYHTTNCYAYALGLDIRERKIVKDAYKPGAMSGYEKAIKKNQLFIREDLIKAIFMDMDLLGIQIKQINLTDNIDDDAWKIALFITRYSKYSKNLDDFHFLREVSNNMWYHKVGFDSRPTNLDDNYNIINNPKECFLKNREYDSCYCLKLKKGGIYDL